MTQKVGDVREEVLERPGASSIKTFIDSLVGDSNARIVPHAMRSKQAPDSEAAGGATEDAKEKGGPKEQGREDAWTSGAGRGGVFRNKVGKEHL